MQYRLSMVTALVLGVLGCAQTQGEAGEKSAPAPSRLRCRTELEYRPGPLGTMGQSTPVQKCEPIEVPTLSPGELPSPGKTPAPTTQSVPAPKSETPPSGDR